MAIATVMAFSKAALRLDLLRRQVFPHHLDDAAAAFRGHADVTGIGGGDRRCARQRHADGFRDGGHGEAVPMVMQVP
jgi:hypothetical protein